MKKLLPLVLLAAACGETTSTATNQLNLDRPVDVAFACVGGLRLTQGAAADPSQTVLASTAQPTAACTIRSGARLDGNRIPVPTGQEDLSAAGGAVIPGARWVGLILQQGPGTVAISEVSTKPGYAIDPVSDTRIVDADPLTPGSNSISVGEDPIAIGTDRAGCKAIIANAGSCDLSVLDISSVFDAETGADVQRLAVTNAAGVPIRSKPAAMVMEPQATDIGFACPATAQGLAYVAYPSCRLVAGVDVATGQIVTGVQYDDAGVPAIVDGNVTCPDECGVGTPALPGVRPVTVDLELDPRTGTRRLAIGAANAASLTVVELDIASRPISLFQIALEDPTGKLGVTHLAMSRSLGMGGEGTMIDDENAPGGDFQFIYAVATDGTVRVADILNVRRECDANIDARFLREGVTIAELGCLPIGDPDLPRRAGAKGPGIELVAGAVPTSVDFVRPDFIDPNTPNALLGTFAIVSALNGNTFVINVDDDAYPDQFIPSQPLNPPAALVVPHQPRDAVGNRGEVAIREVDPDGSGPESPVTVLNCDDTGTILPNGAAEGGPRASGTPARIIPTGFYAPEKQTQLPAIRQVLCEGTENVKAISELQFAASVETRDRAFPDLRGLRGDEFWTLTWEGSLSNSSLDSDVDGPAVRESLMRVDAFGLHLTDPTRPYCDAGVEPYDIVQLRGCDPGLGDIECPVGYRCYVHPQSQVQGIGACMLDDEAERLAEACKDFLTTVRRYTVKQATTGELQLMARRHELRTTPLDGCVSDEQCESLADYAARTVTPRHPVDDQATVDNRTWVCRADPTRAPRGNGQRCNLACDANADCATGTICAGGDPSTPALDGLCMESVVPPQACVNAPQRYELRAGEAFTVVGSRSGYVHPTIAQNNVCVRDPAANPLTVGRIPLQPPPCFADADPITGRRPDGTPEPNPCSTTVSHTEPVPNYVAGTCTLDPNMPGSLVERQAPALKFRNRGMTFHIVDPYYPGDNQCIVDRQGPGGMPLVKVPVLFSGYQLQFRQIAGFSPLVVPVNPSFPKRVVRGPLESVWVIDEGDFLSTSISQASTRGKVFVVQSQDLGVSLLQ